jgi:hypothetical protein
MNTQKYNRSVALMCPTCGGSQFSPVSPNNVESVLQECADCDREITRDDLIHEKSENIEEHLNEIKKEVTKDIANNLKKQLASAFNGSKFIKIK